MQNSFLDIVMPFISEKAYMIFFIIVLFTFAKEKKKVLLPLMLSFFAFIIGDMSSNMLKHLFEMPRPCQALEGVRLLSACGSSSSFPSGHAVDSFAVAAVFSHFFRRIAFLTFPLAALVALSRVYLGVHYPLDVIAGAVWGGVIAWMIIVLQGLYSENFKKNPGKTVFTASVIGLIFFRYYYIITGPLDLSPDEAHYWEWARRLDLSYYSKGPLTAWLIGTTTWLAGDSPLGIRFLAPLFLASSSTLVYLLTLNLFPNGRNVHIKACAAGMMFQLAPLFSAYGIVMTIDSPFIFFWTLSLYLFWKAVGGQSIRRRAQSIENNSPFRKGGGGGFEESAAIWIWIFLGITIGLGLLTKYTMAFFYVCAFLFLIFSKEERAWLKRKEPYLSLATSILVFSPVIIWNINHDWVTLKHTAGQAHISEGMKISFRHFFEFIGSQAGVISPLIFILAIYGAVKNRRSFTTAQNTRFLFWFWAPVFSFFLLKSLQAKVQANWAMPAYVTAFIASADYFLNKDILRKGIKILLISASVTLLAFAIVTHYPSLINLPVKQDPTSRLRGWKELGVKVDEIYDEMASSGERGIFIFSDKYQVSGELAFYMQSHPVTYNVNLGRRMNQYDIWEGFENLLGYDAIFVRDGDENLPVELETAFDRAEKEIFTVYRKDEKALRKYVIFKCYNFRGLPKKVFESY
ncbi:MAG: glycosyltransferase family 39 protein [Nitrospirae bacterium]|nr:glycosyltransferase family 39 protein [Nitrospirota bacterium]